MCDGENSLPVPEHWAIVLQKKLQIRVRSGLVASFLLFGLPFLVIYGFLSLWSGSFVWSRGSLFAFLWLCLAPFMLAQAFDLAVAVAKYYPAIALEIREYCHVWQRRYYFAAIFIGLPGVLAWFLYPEAPWPIRVFYVVISIFTQVLASMGFWAVIVAFFIGRRLGCKITFDVFHGDSFGGLGFLGQEVTKGFIFFSTGVLFIPVVTELGFRLSKSNLCLSILPYVLFWLIIGSIVVGFFGVNYWLYLIAKRHIEGERHHVGLRMGQLIRSLCDSNSELTLSDYNRAQLMYTIYYKHLAELRPWPFNVTVILQLIVSLVLPLVVAVLDVLKLL